MIFEELTDFWQDESGQDMVEYSLLLAFIALASIGLLSGMKPALSTLYSTINKGLTSANSAAT
jgi:Flp pilus assembly pilin Flp